MKKAGLFLLPLFAVSLLGSVLVVSNKENKEAEVAEAYGKSSYWDTWVTNNSSKIATGGTTLMTALKSKIGSGTSTVSYNNLWAAYKDTDAVPNTNGNYIWDTYGGIKYAYQSDGSSIGSALGSGYNREHSVPRSWFTSGESGEAYSDLFHLMPTDVEVNRERGNLAFGEVSTVSKSYTLSAQTDGNGQTYQTQGTSKIGTPKAINGVSPQNLTTKNVFEPDDQYKGDFARNYMYFITRYGGGTYSPTRAGYDGLAIFTTTYTDANPYVTDYGLALLYKWHKQDPVSQKEIDRNNAIEKKQNNRNPFIDYPEWGDKIFGSDSPSASITPASPSVAVGSTVQLTATLTNVTSANSITWTSDNTNVATVEKGTTSTSSSIATVTGVSASSTTINCKYNGNTIGSVTITVTSSGGGGGGSSDTLTIAVSDIPGTYSSTSFSVGDYSFGCSNIGNSYQSGAMQWKNGQGYMYNVTAISGITSISMASASTGTFTGTVYVSTTASHPTSGTSYTLTNGNSVDISGSPSYFTIQVGSVTGGGKSGDITITYGSSSSGPVLSSISVNHAPDKVDYTTGEFFDPTGLVINRVYTDSSLNDTYTYANHESDFGFNPDLDDPLVANGNVTITYGGKSTTQAITVTAGGGGDSSGDAHYVKITSVDEIIDGREYIIAALVNNTYYAMSSTFSTSIGGAQITVSNACIITNSNSSGYTVTLVKTGNYYSIYNGTSYLAANTSSTNLATLSSNSDDSAKWSITNSASYGTFAISNVNVTNKGLIYRASTYNCFKGYAKTNPNGTEYYNVELFRAYTAEDYANEFIDSFECDVQGSSTPDFENGYSWSVLESSYTNKLTSNQKTILHDAQYTKTGSGSNTNVVAQSNTNQTVAEAMARYDYIVGKYNPTLDSSSAWKDFVGRSPAPVGVNRITIDGVMNNNASTVAVVIISLVSVSAVGGYFLLRRKKQK